MTVVESLECRRLLAVTFNPTDLAGTWSIFGQAQQGSVTFDASGDVTGGFFVDDSSTNIIVTGGAFSITPAGIVQGDIQTDPVVPILLDLTGAMTSNKDVMAVSDKLLPAVGEPVELTLIRNGVDLTTADLAGVWTFPGQTVSSSIRISETGEITGSLFISDLDRALNVNGSVSLSGTGSGTGAGSIVISQPGQGQLLAQLTGALSPAEDLLGVSVQAVQLGPGPSSAILVRRGGIFSTADVVGSWTLASVAGRATINFDGAGRISGGTGTSDTGAVGTYSGRYSVSEDGVFSGTFDFLSGGITTRAALTGQINASKNFIVIDGAPFPDSFSLEAETSYLLRPDGAFATLESGRLTVSGTDATDITGLSVRNGRLNVTQNGVTQKFNPSSITSISASMGDGNDIITLGGGVIGSSVLGGNGKDSLAGGDGADILNGEAGNDLITGGNGFDTLYGGDGNDRLEGQGNGDSLRGGRGHDTLTGGTSNDRLFGDTGNDSLDGGRQSDRLDGGADADTVFGSDDNDTIFARDLIADMLDGGAGDDSAQVDEIDSKTNIETLLA